MEGKLKEEGYAGGIEEEGERRRRMAEEESQEARKVRTKQDGGKKRLGQTASARQEDIRELGLSCENEEEKGITRVRIGGQKGERVVGAR